MPLGEAILEFVAEIFAQGFFEGIVGLVRRLGALVRSLVTPRLSYRAALRGSGNVVLGMLVLGAFALLIIVLS